MGSTNKTANYDLSQYIGTDVPSWLQDYNGDMAKIDAQMKKNEDAIGTGDTGLEAVKSRVTAQEQLTANMQTEITSQTDTITSIKADYDTVHHEVVTNTSNIDSLTTRVTNNTSNIDSLTTRVTNNTSNIDSLTTRVTNNEGNISSLGTSVTGIEDKLGTQTLITTDKTVTGAINENTRRIIQFQSLRYLFVDAVNGVDEIGRGILESAPCKTLDWAFTNLVSEAFLSIKFMSPGTYNVSVQSNLNTVLFWTNSTATINIAATGVFNETEILCGGGITLTYDVDGTVIRGLLVGSAATISGANKTLYVDRGWLWSNGTMDLVKLESRLSSVLITNRDAWNSQYVRAVVGTVRKPSDITITYNEGAYVTDIE